jgi:hypothetical protein
VGLRSDGAVHNRAMEADLRRIKVALAAMSKTELDSLIDATYKVDKIAPGLLGWLDTACVWQLHWRNGYHFELQPPEAAIPPEEDPVSIDAAIAMRATFGQYSPAVRALFDTLVPLLTGVGK